MSPIEVPSALSEVMPDDPRRRLPILCATYEPRGDSRRCKHFVPNGACVLPNEFMCVEWLRVNAPPPPLPRPPPLQATLFPKLPTKSSA